MKNKTIQSYPRFVSFEIPTDWDYLELGKIFEIVRGISYNSSDVNEIGIGSFLVNLNCFDNGGGFIDKGLLYFNSETTKNPIIPGEFLIAITEVTREAKIIGYPLIVPKSENIKPIFHSMDTAHLKLITNEFDRKFLFYFLSSELCHKSMVGFSGGTTVLHLNLDSIKKIKIPKPPIQEQEKIGLILSNIDLHIQTQQKIINKSKKLRTIFRQKLFVNGLGNIPPKKSTLPQKTTKSGYRAIFQKWLKKYPRIPKTWEIKTLDDICEKIIGGGTPPMNEPSYFHGDIPWITVKDMTELFISISEITITDKAVKESSTNIIPENNIIISTRMGLGSAFINTVDVAINQDLKGLILKKDVDPFYVLEYLLKESEMFKTAGQGTTVKGIEQNFVKNFPIPFPTPDEQKEISKILKIRYNYENCYTKQKEALEQMKKGLMQQLLTGQKRVKI